MIQNYFNNSLNASSLSLSRFISPSLFQSWNSLLLAWPRARFWPEHVPMSTRWSDFPRFSHTYGHARSILAHMRCVWGCKGAIVLAVRTFGPFNMSHNNCDCDWGSFRLAFIWIWISRVSHLNIAEGKDVCPCECEWCFGHPWLV